MVDTNENPKAGGISIHAVDVSRGIPAANLYVHLRRIDPDFVEIAAGCCVENGHFQHPMANIVRGVYEIEFNVGAYYRGSGITLPDPSFLDVAVFRFGIDRVNEHFHLPFKFTPWGFSLFRGGA